MWTASMAPNARRFQNFANFVWKWANETTTRWPLSDWYYTDSPTAVGFRARSVIGGFWMKILMDRCTADDPTGIQQTIHHEPFTMNQMWAYTLEDGYIEW